MTTDLSDLQTAEQRKAALDRAIHDVLVRCNATHLAGTPFLELLILEAKAICFDEAVESKEPWALEALLSMQKRKRGQLFN